MSANLPCAIYTRKSSSEGLEQSFNSMDAQREACEAYILSQKAEGWKHVKTAYNDGGYSGGNTERPALQKLLDDIRARRIKIVVVYKVDRLTRSLADFAKLIELFDAHGVSFVSVTQQFNTTNSMGRLTLNVLLSFAQFEREVTSERIRDKIAASKAKGMWMGGNPPMGYLPSERSLKIDEPQAERVREMHRMFLEFGNIKQLQQEVNHLGWLTPQRHSRRDRDVGGRAFSRGHLRNILQNPIYRGQIVHKGQTYQGLHPAIIDEHLWASTQAQLQDILKKHHTPVHAEAGCLLTGLLFNSQGEKYITHHTRKNNGVRYHYYRTAPNSGAPGRPRTGLENLPGIKVEEVVKENLIDLLRDQSRLLEVIGNLDSANTERELRHAAIRLRQLMQGTATEKIEAFHCLIERLTIFSEHIEVALKPSFIVTEKKAISPFLFNIPIRLRGRGNALRLVIESKDSRDSSAPDPKLGALLVKAHDWLSKLTSGRYDGVQAIAAEEKLTSSYVTRVIYLAYLAPHLALRILKGEHPPELNTKKLLGLVPLPEHWKAQQELLRM